MATIIKHVKGNVLRLMIPLTLKIKALIDGEVVEREEPFYPDIEKDILVRLRNAYTIPFTASVNGNIVSIEDKGTLQTGLYLIEVLCYGQDGNPYRYMARDVLEVVDATIDAGIQAGIEFNAETYTLNGAVFISYVSGGSFEQVQSDWNESDDTSPAYIKNKPNTEKKVGIVPIDIQDLPSPSIVAEVDKYYNIIGNVDTIDITLPLPTDDTTISSIIFFFTTGGTAPIVTITSTVPILYQYGYDIEAGKTYEVNCLFNGNQWIVASTIINLQ